MEIMVDIKDEGLVLNVSIAAPGPPGPPGPPGEGVPEYSEADNGKYLRVMDGAPQWAEGPGGGGGSGNVSSADITTIVVLDLEEYDAIEQKDAQTLYLIRG